MKEQSMITTMKHVINKISEYISVKYIVIYFSLMAVLYIFMLFGSMFSSTDFTYADF